MHEEWFPLDYPDKFYRRVLQKSGIIAKGCFIQFYDKESKITHEVLVASIISRVKSGKEDAQEIINHLEKHEISQMSWFQYLLSNVTCK